MSQVLRIQSLSSDGSVHDELIDIPIKNAAGQPFLGDDNLPSVVVKAFPLTTTEWRRRLQSKKYTKQELNKRSKQLEEVTDTDRAVMDLLQERVKEWRGIEGFDGKPLVCNAATIAELDMSVQYQLLNAIVGASVAEVAAVEAGFSESQ